MKLQALIYKNLRNGVYVTQINYINLRTFLFLHIQSDSLFIIASDFAIVPEPLVFCYINESMMLVYDFTALNQINAVANVTYISTPRCGRVSIDYYNSVWLPNNQNVSAIIASSGLIQTVSIDSVTPADAGVYTIEVKVSTNQVLSVNKYSTTVMFLGLFH